MLLKPYGVQYSFVILLEQFVPPLELFEAVRVGRVGRLLGAVRVGRLQGELHEFVAGVLVIIGRLGGLGQRVHRELLVLPDHPDERGLVALHRGDAGEQALDGGFGRGEDRLEMVEIGLGCDGVVVVVDLGLENQFDPLVRFAEGLSLGIALENFGLERNRLIVEKFCVFGIVGRLVLEMLNPSFAYGLECLEFLFFQSQFDVFLSELPIQAKIFLAKIVDLVLHSDALPIGFKFGFKFGLQMAF